MSEIFSAAADYLSRCQGSTQTSHSCTIQSCRMECAGRRFHSSAFPIEFVYPSWKPMERCLSCPPRCSCAFKWRSSVRLTMRRTSSTFASRVKPENGAVGPCHIIHRYYAYGYANCCATQAGRILTEYSNNPARLYGSRGGDSRRGA
jgi:hypothetical protein